MTGAIEQQVSEAVRFAVNDAVRPIAQKLDTLYSIEAKRMMNKAEAVLGQAQDSQKRQIRRSHCHFGQRPKPAPHLSNTPFSMAYL